MNKNMKNSDFDHHVIGMAGIFRKGALPHHFFLLCEKEPESFGVRWYQDTPENREFGFQVTGGDYCKVLIRNLYVRDITKEFMKAFPEQNAVLEQMPYSRMLLLKVDRHLFIYTVDTIFHSNSLEEVSEAWVDSFLG